MANNVLANKLLPVCVDKLAQNERANIVSKVFLTHDRSISTAVLTLSMQEVCLIQRNFRVHVNSCWEINCLLFFMRRF